MTKVIQVIEVSIYTYHPDLDDSAYKENGIACIEEAMKHDQKDCEAGEITPDELSINHPVTTRVWSIIGE